MPAFVNISVGSFFTTIGAEGVIICPFDLKKSKKRLLISCDFINTKKKLQNWFAKLIFLVYFCHLTIKNQVKIVLFRNRKYILDSADLQFKQVKFTFKDKVIRVLLRFVLSGVLAIIYVSIFKSLFGSPKVEFLNQQLGGIKLNYSLIAMQLDNSMSRLNDLRLSDDMRYRPILDMDSLPETYRKAGVGGIDRYRSHAGFMNSNMMISYRTKLDIISTMANVQKESFKSVTDRAAEWKIEMDHQPMISPVDVKYSIGDVFRFRAVHPVLGTPRMHWGLDFRTPYGTEVYATGNGTVFAAGWNSGLGNHIVIDHGYGLRTTYGHLNRILVTKGGSVKRGDMIGLSGNSGLSSGPHLHYEVHEFGQYKNPINFFNNDITTEEYNEMIQVFASRYKFR